MKHLIITPAKNEANYIENTIKSVINQSLLPIEWIIVDDGSTDNTKEVIEPYLQKYKWIKLICLENKSEERAGGGKVVKAFNRGYAEISDSNFDFITKLDADLTLPVTYFENISNALRVNPKLGICGGVCYVDNGQKLVKERADIYHVRGALKSIKKDCYVQIGGFKPVLHWDGIDEYTARFYGWFVQSINEQVIHHRPTSNAYKPIKYNYRNGYAARQRRASFVLSLLRSIHKIRTSPYFLNSIAYLYGYIMAIIKNEKNILTNDISNSMNEFDYLKIFNKKKFNQKYLSNV